MANNIQDSLNQLMTADGAKAAALVDAHSGLIFGKAGTGIDLDLAAAGNSEVVKAKLNIMKKLGLTGGIEDILITLETQYHIIRPTDLQDGLFFYLVLEKAASNLAMARRAVMIAEQGLKL